MDKSSVRAKFSADQSPTLLLLIGCCLPISATFLDLLRHGLSFSLANVIAVQTIQPLHWVIDSIPLLALFLGQMIARTKRLSTSARSYGQGETAAMSTTKLTQVVNDLKADLAKQRRAEETLRASEEFYRTLVENTNDGIATISLDGTLTSVNRGFELMLGKNREEVVGKHYSTILSISSLALIEDRIRRFQAGEKMPSLFECELLHRNGSALTIEARVRAINDKNGTPIGFQGVYRDTAKRAALKKIGSVTQTTSSHPEISSISGAITGGTDTSIPPWMRSSSQPESNDLPHQPPGYSPLSRATPTSSVSFLAENLESHNQTSQIFPDVPVPTLSAAGSSLSPSLATPELQVAIPPSPQFRSAEAASDSSLSSSLSIPLSEQPESFTVPFQFTASKDQVKKDEQQAKVVPFPTSSVQGSSLSLPPQLGSASSQNMLNLDEALNRVDGDRELLSEMAGVFLDEYPLLLVTMQDALSHGNAQTLTYAVHTLKGSVANFAATSVFEAALKLEKIGRQGNLTQAKTALAELEAELARLAPLLTTLKLEAAA